MRRRTGIFLMKKAGFLKQNLKQFVSKYDTIEAYYSEGGIPLGKRRRNGGGGALMELVFVLMAIVVFLAAWIAWKGEELPLPEITEKKAPEPVTFTREDAEPVELWARCGCTAEVEPLLLTDLNWNLQGDGPRVLIIHTHATECYTETGADFVEYEEFRTLDEAHNMIAVGEALTRALEKGGIQVIHDTGVYDYPDYDMAYDSARALVQGYLTQYPSIQLVLDVHRDSVELEDGGQWAPTATVNGKESAQLMLVVGTACDENNNPAWRTNLSVAVKLQAQLEKMYPGFCREVELLSSRYNQDLLGASLLVEIGMSGNTLEQAKVCAETLAEGILAISGGTRAAAEEDPPA